MADIDDVLDALGAVGTPAEILAAVAKVGGDSALVAAATSWDFEAFTTENATELVTKVTEAGGPAEVKASLNKIKALLINA